MRIILINIVFFIGILGVSSCNKDEKIYNDDITLNFSDDTVYFDTVLSTLSSVTGYLKVYNPYDEKIIIESIRLAGGSQSFFRINIDGTDGIQFNQFPIPARDSVFIFINMTVDPLDLDNPLLIKDSLVFTTHTSSQNVKLRAYGQDVHLFKGEVFETQTWTKDKPYLIDRGAAIDFDEVLTIEAGTRIFLTPQSSLEVRGRINARGTLDEPILFTGSRFDGEYEGTAGQWGAVFIHQESQDNYLEHVIIKNASAGLQVGYPDEENRASVTLENCMILNSGAIGIYAFNADITAYNTVIADSRYMAVLIQMGGVYNFYHCTISNFSASYPDLSQNYAPRESHFPSLFFTNYFNWFDLDTDYRIVEANFPMDLELNFYNSIVYGEKPIEIRQDSITDVAHNYKFDHCLLKLDEDSLHLLNPNRLIAVQFNDNPAFINDSIPAGDYDFQLDSNSAAIDKGDVNILQGISQLANDFNGNPRSDGSPDLGAYER